MSRSRVAFALLLLLPLPGLPAAAQPPAAEPEAAPPPVAEPEPVAEARPGHRWVESIRRLVPGGGRVDVSAQGDRIAYDRGEAGTAGRRQVWVSDLGGGHLRCITCQIYEFRKADVGNPAWHPSGDALVVQVQRLGGRPDPGIVGLAGPQRAVGSELWLVPLEGRQVYRLSPTEGNRTDPYVSHEADRLLWTERLHGGGAGPWGEWGVIVAQLDLTRGGIPRLGKARTLQPGPGRGLLLAQGFTPDDRGFLFEAGGNLYRSGFEEGEWTVVQEAEGVRYGSARPASVAGILAWTSDRNLPAAGAQSRLPAVSDVWLGIERDGRITEERLTFFNDPDSDHFLGEALVDDLAWSPDGDRLLLHVVSASGRQVEEGIWIVELDVTR